MLFNSYIFIFIFLPVTLALFHFFRVRVNFRSAIFVLTAGSLFYYGWWSPRYLVLLGTLIILNYISAQAIIFSQKFSAGISRGLLFMGIAGNLAVLCYYKYANFFVDNLNHAAGTNFILPAIVLPIGISFFTFQKIAFLVDIHQNKVKNIKFLDYALFVSFFPQLIAGPITHHSEIIPQFTRAHMKVSLRSVQAGVVFFIIGLAKKVILADTAAKFAGPQFQAVAGGMRLDFLSAWSAALSYSAQLYFDFSAYSDMAIGISQFFGINLPLNFDSPYKSANIIEFWRRWHMTLSRFLRDYLYIPLGGNKKGKARRYINLFITMTLGGIWHGAGWTYAAWGMLHGVYLMINHSWRAAWETYAGNTKEFFLLKKAGQIITFLSVVAGWVFFRSASLESAFVMLKSMAGGYGFSLPPSLGMIAPHFSRSTAPVDSGIALVTALAILSIAWLAPTTQQLTGYIGPESMSKIYELSSAKRNLRWLPSFGWALWLGVLLAVSLMMFSRISEFIYFQF